MNIQISNNDAVGLDTSPDSLDISPDAPVRLDISPDAPDSLDTSPGCNGWVRALTVGIIIGAQDLWVDFTSWVRRSAAEISAWSVRGNNLPTTRSLRATCEGPDGVVDITHLITYYYQHDEYLTVGSLYRWLARFGLPARVDIMFLLDGVVRIAYIDDGRELLTGAEIPGDELALATLPSRAHDESYARL